MPDKFRRMVEEQWMASMRQVLRSMTPESCEIVLAAESTGEQAQEEVWSWYSQPMGNAPGGMIYAGATKESWSALGRLALASRDVEEATPEDIQTTCADIIAQSNRALARDLGKRLKAEIACGAMAASVRPGECQATTLTIGAAGYQATIKVSMDESIFTYLASLGENLPGSIPDLRLDLHATLGRMQVPLSRVLNLTIGSVIDTGRSAGEAVDLVANGKVIALGPLVTVAGRYAIKIDATTPRMVEVTTGQHVH
jgi:flagellar motor switch protein FliN/FliY